MDSTDTQTAPNSDDAFSTEESCEKKAWKKPTIERLSSADTAGGAGGGDEGTISKLAS